LITSHSSGSTGFEFQGRIEVKKLIAAAAAAALAVSPTVAAAQTAPVQVAPAVEQAEGEELRGRGFILPLIGIVAIIIAIILLTKNDDDDGAPITP
jgi:hypothetical protein